MIHYEPFWSTLEKKKITKYQLIYHWGISSNTLRRMKRNEPISSTTLNELCLILGCRPQDIMCFEATVEEVAQTEEKRKIIKTKSKQIDKP